MVIRCLYNLFYTIVSLSLLAVVYLINSNTDINTLVKWHNIEIPKWVSYGFYCASSVFLTWISSKFFSFFERQDIKNNNIKSIESADGIFIPTYLAYIFVGLSVKGITELLFCYTILVVICFAAQIYLFNPIFYLLGYKFYFVTNSINKKLLVMTKKKILLSETVDFSNLYRINDYTYVEL